MGHFVIRYEDELRTKYIPDPNELKAHQRFSNNEIVQFLLNNEKLQDYWKKNQIHWEEDESFLRKLFMELRNQEFYQAYSRNQDSSTRIDAAFLAEALGYWLNNSEALDNHLEDLFPNWQDDSLIAFQMVERTLKELSKKPNESSLIEPTGFNDEKVRFGNELMHSVINQEEVISDLVNQKTSKWESNQLSKVDELLVKMGITEFVAFPSIPTKVTINEYIEISKEYSAPMSKKFVNGILDSVLIDLKKEGKIHKTERGLRDK
jgi:N utilization substance protein B